MKLQAKWEISEFKVFNGDYFELDYETNKTKIDRFLELGCAIQVQEETNQVQMDPVETHIEKPEEIKKSKGKSK